MWVNVGIETTREKALSCPGKLIGRISRQCRLQSLYDQLLGAAHTAWPNDPEPLLHEPSLERYLRSLLFRSATCETYLPVRVRPVFMLADEAVILGELYRQLKSLSPKYSGEHPPFHPNQNIEDRLGMVQDFGRRARTYLDQNPNHTDDCLRNCAAASSALEWSRLAREGMLRLAPEDEPEFLAAGWLGLWHLDPSNTDALLYHGVYPESDARLLVDHIIHRVDRRTASFGSVNILHGFNLHEIAEPGLKDEKALYTHQRQVAQKMAAASNKEEAEQIAKAEARKGKGAKRPRHGVARLVGLQNLPMGQELRLWQELGLEPSRRRRRSKADAGTTDRKGSLERSGRQDMRDVGIEPRPPGRPSRSKKSG